MKLLAIRYNSAALILQRYSKKYLVYKVWGVKLHRAVIDKIQADFRVIKHKLLTNAQIKIRFAWRCYKQHKRIKKEKKKKAADAKNAKKKGKTKRSAAATMPAPALSTTNYQTKNDKNSSVKQTADGQVDIQI